MPRTLVIQSQRLPLPQPWLQPCIESVQHWARLQGFAYRFLDDQLFDLVSPALLHKTRRQKVIATDLARLKALQAALAEGYERVLWCDADFLIFNPARFSLLDASYALGREVWVQARVKKPQQLEAKIKVHNAFLLFCRANSFLDFYCETAERLLHLNTGTMPPQFIGPKLLSALHNIAHCPVQDSAGMLSPLTSRAILGGDGEALRLFEEKSPAPVYAANLCTSLHDPQHPQSLGSDEMFKLIARLQRLTVLGTESA